ncbi:MAG: ribonuclease P protein component [Bacteroidetes bacterium]|nr:ribonuclease P protein component [Bacteroidota bacterium]
MHELKLELIKAFSYNKSGKLKSKRQIDTVFKAGKSFKVFPIKVFYLIDEGEKCLQCGVGVSSRFFKNAVDRNRIKRLLREAYRTEQQSLHDFLNNKQKQLNVFLLFIDKSLPEYPSMKTKMKICINRLIKEMNEADFKNT